VNRSATYNPEDICSLLIDATEFRIIPAVPPIVEYSPDICHRNVCSLGLNNYLEQKHLSSTGQ